VSENPYESSASVNEYAPARKASRHRNLVRAVVCLPTGIVASYFGVCYAVAFGVSLEMLLPIASGPVLLTAGATCLLLWLRNPPISSSPVPNPPKP
jgi:hypothetical protein